MVPVALAGPASCETRNNNTIAKLLECVEVEGVREHQAAFQAIADANGGIRTSGTPGYDDSVDYVVDRMEAAGYDVSVQEFDFQTFINLAPPLLTQVAPPPGGPVENNIMSYSGSGDVEAPVTALPAPPADATPGCEATDFVGFPAGNIALISRGACTFAIKVTNAFDAGAVGVVVYNNVPGPIAGTLGNEFTLDIPVTSVSQEVGEQLVATPGLVLSLTTETFRGQATTSNVFAERTGKNDSNVVMAGGHLDSVDAGPGINDNGSGSAALLEVAEQMAKVKPQNTLRFAWWGAEEANLVGSTFYVDSLSQAELDEVALYLNFDMVGSPNHVFFIYDGDDSDAVGAGPGPAGSDLIEEKFEEFFDSRGLPFKGTDFSGRSDYGPFIAAGVPSGGLFTGAEGIKTAEEAVIWGGVAGEQYDHCYHQACDTFDNVNLGALDANSDAIAYATLSFAMSTELINGTKSKGNFKPAEDLLAPTAS
jgi:aminopeptidase Y